MQFKHFPTNPLESMIFLHNNNNNKFLLVGVKMHLNKQCNYADCNNAFTRE